jgi:hypothetical protein
VERCSVRPHFSRVVCVSFWNGAKQTSGRAAVMARLELREEPAALTGIRGFHRAIVPCAAVAGDGDHSRSERSHSRRVRVWDAMKRPLTFGSRLMAVKQLANVNVNGPGASWQRLLLQKLGSHCIGHARRTRPSWQRFARPNSL